MDKLILRKIFCSFCKHEFFLPITSPSLLPCRLLVGRVSSFSSFLLPATLRRLNHFVSSSGQFYSVHQSLQQLFLRLLCLLPSKFFLFPFHVNFNFFFYNLKIL